VDHGVERATEMEVLGDILLDELKSLLTNTVGQVVSTAGNQVVENHYLVAALEQMVSQVRAEKARSTGDQTA
jgi:hypothetical protein